MKKIKILQNIQYIIGLILCLMIVFFVDNEGMIKLDRILKYLPIGLWIINVVSFVFEMVLLNKMLKKKAFIRAIFMVLSIVIIALLLPDFDNINIILSLLSVVYLIMMLAVTIKYASLGKTKVVNDPQTLEVGYFSKKHRKQVYLVLGLSFLVAVAVIFLFDMLLETGIFVAMLMAFPVIFIFILVGNVLVNPLQKAIKKFHKDQDFLDFEKTVLSLKENNLHPDTNSYLDAFYGNYLATYDVAKSIEWLNQVERPTYKTYIPFYDMFLIINAVNEENYEESYARLNAFIQNHPKQKLNYINLERSVQIYLTTDEVLNVETLYPINKKYPLVNLINANLLMVYYKKRGNLEKAKYYAEFIINNTTTLKQYINDANEVLNTDE